MKDGTVVATMDGISDNPRVGEIRDLSIDELGMNQVLLEVANGTYACYAHLLPGSVQVMAGDYVKGGDVVGSIGNSDAPHLHFQVCDAPDLLGSEGLPFVFQGFEETGRCIVNTYTGRFTCVTFDSVRLHEGEIPENNRIIRFPEIHE